MGDEIRGITRRDELVWALFRDLARGDFRHDFNERVATRDLITASDGQRFTEIAKRVSTKGNVWLQKKFKEYVGQTIFTVLSPSFDAVLPPRMLPAGVAKPPAPDATFYDEVELLKKVGLDFEKLKQAVSTAQPGAAAQSTFTIPGLQARSYTIRSSPYRLGPKGSPEYSKNRNITQMFREVTGGKEKFALIVDASGGLPLTELLNTSLEPYSVGGEFYIIENIENTGDSATKLSSLPRRDTKAKPAPTVRFLRDKVNTVVYPLWSVPSDPKSNIYSSLQIVLNRISDDEVEANISILDNKGKPVNSFQIGDLSNSSNVKNATLYALAVFLEKGLVPEAFVYTLIKRMGDWCQALSLLDLDRVYSVLDEAKQEDEDADDVTLRDMLVDTEIGIVTNDRILLGFAILLGLNVFFTTAMDTARLIYFKNNNDIPSGPQLEARSKQIYDQSQTNPSTQIKAYKTLETQKIGAMVAKIKAEKDIALYIYEVKTFATNVGKLRDEFETLQVQYDEAKAKYAATKGVERFNAATTMASILAKVALDIEYNTQTLGEMESMSYPGSQANKIRLESLQKKLAAGGRITKSIEVVESKEILYSIRDDLYQIMLKNTVPVKTLASILRLDFTVANSRIQTNYDEILATVKAIQLILPEGQRGGGVTNLDAVVSGIRTRTVRIIPAGTEESTSAINIYTVGSKFIDEKLRAYTVVDECIVTLDDYPIFDLFFGDMTKTTTPPADPKALYICLKYLLLRCDMLEHRLNSLMYSVAETDGATEAGTIQTRELIEIKNRLVQLENALKHPWFGAIDNYHETYQDETIAGTPDDVLKRIIAVRNQLAGVFASAKFPVVLNQAEIPETIAIEQATKYATIRVGYYREAIYQKLAPLISPALSKEETAEIARILEEALDRVMLETITREQDTTDPRPTIAATGDQVAAAIASGLQKWFEVRRPKMNATNILAYIQTIAKTIRDEETAKKGGLRGRRPLYSNARASSASILGSNDNARLRKRARPRRTYRVRKQSRKSKTR